MRHHFRQREVAEAQRQGISTHFGTHRAFPDRYGLSGRQPPRGRQRRGTPQADGHGDFTGRRRIPFPSDPLRESPRFAQQDAPKRNEGRTALRIGGTGDADGLGSHLRRPQGMDGAHIARICQLLRRSERRGGKGIPGLPEPAPRHHASRCAQRDKGKKTSRSASRPTACTGTTWR